MSLSKETSGKALDNITLALPISIAQNIKQSIIEQVFVWVTKDNDTANSLAQILLENGFYNILLDSSSNTGSDNGGTTVTAQSSDVNASPNEETCSNTTAVSSCSSLSASDCLNTSYEACTPSNGCTTTGGYHCFLNTSTNECSTSGGCDNCNEICSN